MTARETFAIGDRVRLDNKGAWQYYRKRKEVIGRVVGFSRDPNCVRVRIDGQVSESAWHISFWRKILD